MKRVFVSLPNYLNVGVAKQINRHAQKEEMTKDSGFGDQCARFVLLCVGFLLVSLSAPAQQTHYIAANGSDSNNGTSKSTPWLHAPGMPKCSSNCLTYQKAGPSAGDKVILRGGDTWHFGNSSASPYTGGAWDISAWWGTVSACVFEGTQSGCIYWGVDQTWYSGSSWVRPILTGDNANSTSLVASCTYQAANSLNGTPTANVMMVAAPQSVIDNFELTGMCSSDGSPTSGVDDTYIEYFGSGTAGTGTSFLSNLYIHGWSATTSAGQTGNNQPGTILGGGFNGLNVWDHLVIDGSILIQGPGPGPPFRARTISATASFDIPIRE